MSKVAVKAAVPTMEILESWKQLTLGPLAAGVTGSIGFVTQHPTFCGPPAPILLRNGQRRWFGSASWDHLARYNDRLAAPGAAERLQPVLLRRR
ncbi:MAG: hypothetical protein HY319_25635 [Armatimonadetes bacterium]|nr:hypothetical protein [Armatimonadota bacterium]